MQNSCNYSQSTDSTIHNKNKLAYNSQIETILERNEKRKQIEDVLLANDNLPSTESRTCIFVYGKSGVGKTAFVHDILRKLEYDVVNYDAGDIRNKNVFEHLGKTTASTNNVYHLFHKKVKRIVVVMDELEGMNSGDRGGINSLIRIIRPKTNSNQPNQPSISTFTNNQPPISSSSKQSSSAKTDINFITKKTSSKPKKKTNDNKDSDGVFHCSVICICNHNIDKKISEIMKICYNVYIPPPTDNQMSQIAKLFYHQTNDDVSCQNYDKIVSNIAINSRNDLRKLLMTVKILNSASPLNQNNKQLKYPSPTPNTIDPNVIRRVIYGNNFNINVKTVIYNLLHQQQQPQQPLDESIYENQYNIYDSNRTMISLIWHENIIDYIQNHSKLQYLNDYLLFLQNMCIGDYIDRITFQKQIWQLNEMTSYIKVMYNHLLIHTKLDPNKISQMTPNDIRFTKVLTKYSSEYNNYLFMQSLCDKLGIDKKNVISLFACASYKHHPNISAISKDLMNSNLTPLEIKRIHKFIHKIEYINHSKSNLNTNIPSTTQPTHPCVDIENVHINDDAPFSLHENNDENLHANCIDNIDNINNIEII